MISKMFITSFVILTAFISSVALGAVQTVSTTQTNINVSPGGTVDLTVVYTASSPRNTTGVGVQLYYDSSVLTLTGVSNIFTTGSVGAITSANDTANGDTSAATDKTLPAGWFDISNAWPGAVGDIVLFRATFAVAAGFATNTTINFTGDPAIGHTIALSPVTITSTPNPVVTPNVHDVPTLSEWGIIFLAITLVLISGLGGFGAKKSRIKK